jgi:arylsulfatase A-like enzyme
MPTSHPNIVLILADDLGIGDVRCTSGGTGRIPTPHMDACAAAGRILSDAHSNSAVCTPTRYGLLTGRYCWRTSLTRGVLYGYNAPLIETGRATLASVLRDAGYATACIGKWHLGLGWVHADGTGPDEKGLYDPARIDWNAPLSAGPHTVGFDHSCVIPASLDMAPYCYIEDGRLVEAPTAQAANSPRPAFWRAGAMAPGFEHGTCLRELTCRAEAWLAARARRPEQPFFLYFPTPSPHTPHVPRPPFVGATGLGPYGDFVVEHDWAVGRILATLDRHGLTDDTLVIITSDNGAHSQPLGLAELGHRCNAIFRGQKSDAWDGGHRVPFIARWPGRIPAGTVCDRTICLTDLLATCARVADATLPAKCSEDGMEVLDLLTGDGTVDRPPIIHHSITGRFAVRRGPWKYLACPGSGGWSLPDDQVPADAPRAQLYRVDGDPAEEHNLIDAEPAIAAELQALIDACRAADRSV